MRGTPWLNPSRMSIGGIIPAYAGNTDQSIIAFPSCGDHPRVCGEHLVFAAAHEETEGSSPRMRGTLRPAIHSPRFPGIIPAYAGNTCPNGRGSRSDRDHPRVCGEHIEIIDPSDVNAGSSPRMRGTPPWSPRSRGRAGIIPAYAGNTGRLQVSVPGAWDHPRVCGEHKTPSRPEGEKWGSSPRMRGTRRRGSVFLTFNGIIPAYAGNTRFLCFRGGMSWDHPRVCGEHRLIFRWTR